MRGVMVGTMIGVGLLTGVIVVGPGVMASSNTPSEDKGLESDGAPENSPVIPIPPTHDRDLLPSWARGRELILEILNKWSFRNKNLVCCLPHCAEMAVPLCKQMAGDSAQYYKQSCDTLDVCKVGCCKPSCVEMTKTACVDETHGYGSSYDWSPNRCAEDEACRVVCCSFKSLSGDDLIETAPLNMCKAAGGTYLDGPCRGYSAKVKLETSGVGQIGKLMTDEKPLQEEAKRVVQRTVDILAPGVDMTMGLIHEAYAYTCANDVNSTWNIQVTQTVSSNYQGPKSKTKTYEPIKADLSDGEFIPGEKFGMAVKFYKVRVNENEMTIDFDPLVLDVMTGTGAVRPGAKECMDGSDNQDGTNSDANRWNRTWQPVKSWIKSVFSDGKSLPPMSQSEKYTNERQERKPGNQTQNNPFPNRGISEELLEAAEENSR